MKELSSVEEIREIIGEPNPLAAKKIYASLNNRMQEFIKTSPLVMLSTLDELGFPTISPKGDQAGFVKVRDDQTLLLPELRGNKLAFSLQNIVSSNNKVGLIFLRPGTMETLRVHGNCTLVEGDICHQVSGTTHNALLVWEISVKNAYFHCGKPFLRSKVWDQSTYLEPMKISFGQEIAGNTGADEQFIRDTDFAVRGRYKTDL
ncbi:pyridoxamine 5'-phosphate oxidase family protein [Vibrio sp. SCSIO 43135]|uniref:pyridoxamine 5'-phosphate oxidase family protein n=1 Tax=Vibrio sp. SCSIO 43135 TaxID=2819096 RepID=UPI00207614DF|nr:pyridoxamine 5'-phosphate oxidase family protein [Vibrio sp. SCSIO 43135]USD43092.1 pyridoxamine 5'-phosphate oxidase family protein [Vibrio sp. SCSIO 43135]